MKPFYLIAVLVPGLLSFLFPAIGSAQSRQEEARMLFRFYEDNDFFNISGSGTDRAYTNGTRMDLFYQPNHGHRIFPERLFPKAGEGSVDVSGWSLMQLMVTPADLSKSDYQPDDYAYAGALYVIRSFYSFNPEKNFSYQSELIAGIRGPAAFAQQTQTALHSVIEYQKPMGWNNQLDTQPLVNVNFTAEKNLLSWKNVLEVNVGAQLRVGSMIDAISIYPMLRIGRMAPYFNGYLEQYGSFTRGQKQVKTQYYLLFKCVNSFVAYNALLTGTRENHRDDETVLTAERPEISHRIIDVQTGAVIAHGNFSIAYLQTYSTTYRHGLYKHSVGTLALYFRW
jgi:lipid A 3-O-deacylase